MLLNTKLLSSPNSFPWRTLRPHFTACGLVSTESATTRLLSSPAPPASPLDSRRKEKALPPDSRAPAFPLRPAWRMPRERTAVASREVPLYLGHHREKAQIRPPTRSRPASDQAEEVASAATVPSERRQLGAQPARGAARFPSPCRWEPLPRSGLDTT